jgi:hypothetical protein
MVEHWEKEHLDYFPFFWILTTRRGLELVFWIVRLLDTVKRKHDAQQRIADINKADSVATERIF